MVRRRELQPGPARDPVLLIRKSCPRKTAIGHHSTQREAVQSHGRRHHRVDTQNLEAGSPIEFGEVLYVGRKARPRAWGHLPHEPRCWARSSASRGPKLTPPSFDAGRTRGAESGIARVTPAHRVDSSITLSSPLPPQEEESGGTMKHKKVKGPLQRPRLNPQYRGLKV